MKALTLRLQPEMYEQLKLVAEVRDYSVTTIIRLAIAEHVQRAKDDPEFQERLQWYLNRAEKLS